jgi:hypothetical protein
MIIAIRLRAADVAMPSSTFNVPKSPPNFFAIINHQSSIIDSLSLTTPVNAKYFKALLHTNYTSSSNQIY